MQTLDSFTKTLKKPISFLKVHTTGTSPKDHRIVQITIHKFNPDGKSQKGTRLINPGTEIPQEATKINGITHDKVKDAETFASVAQKLSDFLKDTDFCGFHIDFDLKFLVEEFNRSGVEFTTLGRKIIDLGSIYNSMESRDFRAASEFYVGKTIESETIDTEQYTDNMLEIFGGIFKKYEGQTFKNKQGKSLDFNSATLEDLNEVFNKNKSLLDVSGIIALNEDKRPIFTIGKYKQKLVSESVLNDVNYYDWFVNVSDMPSDTKLIVKRIKEKAASATVK